MKRVLLLPLLLIGLAGCVLPAPPTAGPGGDTETARSTEATESGAEETAPADEAEEAESDKSAGAEAEPSAAAPAAGSGDGSQDSPYSPGSTATLGDWEVSIGAANLDANAEVQAADDSNPEPPAGQVYISVPVSVTYNGSGSATTLLALTTSFVPATGEAMQTPALLSGVDQPFLQSLSSGDNVEWTDYYLVDAKGAESGMMFASLLLEPDGAYFALQ